MIQAGSRIAQCSYRGDLLDEIIISSGLLLIVASAALFSYTRVWASQCVTTEGRIVGYHESFDSDDGSTYYFDTIQFTDQNGNTVEGKQYMSKMLWIIAAVLVAIWLAGAVIEFLGDVIHVLLVAAIAFGVFAVVKRKV